MTILLICLRESGQVSLDIAERTYAVRDHVVVLAGHPDDVLHHDAEMLLASGAYRMSTPGEQEQYTTEQRTKGMIQE